MRAYDFEYDDIILSDKGFMICNFNSDNSDTILNGAEIKLTTTPFHNGDINYSICSEYDSRLTATFQICKNNNKWEIIKEYYSEIKYDYLYTDQD